MLTKPQKQEQVQIGKKLLAENRNIVFADFSGVGIELLKKLKSELKKGQAVFKVIKKRLFKISLKETGIEFDPTQFPAQVGMVFIPNELTDSASVIYKFIKELAKGKKEFKILGAYDVAKKAFLTAEEFTIVAKLPPREVLLGQLVGVLAGPIRAFMYVIDQLSKRQPAAATVAGGTETMVERTN